MGRCRGCRQSKEFKNFIDDPQMLWNGPVANLSAPGTTTIRIDGKWVRL